VTLIPWQKRALEDKDGLPAMEWGIWANQPSLIMFMLTTFSEMRANIPYELYDG
jgi:hypothetical protein